MEFPVYVFIVAVVVAAVSLSISIKSTRRRKAHAAGLERYQNIMASAQIAGNTKAQDELLGVWRQEGKRKMFSYPEVQREFEKLYYVIETERIITKATEEFASSADIEVRLDCLAKIVATYSEAGSETAQIVSSRAVIDQVQAKEQLLDILQAHVDALAVQAMTDTTAFTKLTVIRSQTFEMNRGKFKCLRFAPYILRFPPNWNDMVAGHIRNPAIRDFVDIPRELRSGDLRLMALDAVEDANLTRVKVSLAYINSHPHALNEVGHGLANRLGRFVINSEKLPKNNSEPNQD